jgi:hypothetical protein
MTIEDFVRRGFAAQAAAKSALDRATWTRLSPGVYDDNAGGLHLDVGELLASANFADTPENREVLIAAAQKLFRRDLVIVEEP